MSESVGGYCCGKRLLWKEVVVRKIVVRKIVVKEDCCGGRLLLGEVSRVANYITKGWEF